MQATPEMLRCQLVMPHFNSLSLLMGYLPDLLQSLEPLKECVNVTVVDDGSPPLVQEGVLTFCDEMRAEHSWLQPALLYKPNRGKGYAIRTGWRQDATADVLGFVDADGSIPGDAVASLIEKAMNQPNDAWCGIRPVKAQETRTWKRRIMTSSFSFVVHRVLGLEEVDPQCGFKIVPGKAYRNMETHMKVNRFAFDCELLCYLHKFGITVHEVELPWMESPTSTVRAVTDGIQMVTDLLKLKKRLRQDS